MTMNREKACPTQSAADGEVTLACRNIPAISVVVPLHNEEGSLSGLHEQLSAALCSRDYELVFVDDGSTDGSMAQLRQLKAQDSSVRVVRLRRNCGKTAALNAGFALAQAPIIVTIDADLQDDPAEILPLLEKLDSGFDLVSGWRAERSDPLSKRLPSMVFNSTVKRLTGIALHDFNCGLKVYRREVLREIKLAGELHRFVPVLAHRRGFRVTEIPVHHRPRRFGRSKYGVLRLLSGLLDFAKVLFLTTYASRPMRLFGTAGLALLIAGTAVGIDLVAIWLQGMSIGRRPLLILCVLLIVAGLQLISTGLLGEMLRQGTADVADEFSVAETLT